MLLLFLGNVIQVCSPVNSYYAAEAFYKKKYASATFAISTEVGTGCMAVDYDEPKISGGPASESKFLRNT